MLNKRVILNILEAEYPEAYSGRQNMKQISHSHYLYV